MKFDINPMITIFRVGLMVIIGNLIMFLVLQVDSPINSPEFKQMVKIGLFLVDSLIGIGLILIILAIFNVF